MSARRRTAALVAALLAVAGCAPPLPFERDPSWPAAQLLLLGEQHDAAEHQQLSARVVAQLASQRRLAALAMEMAERGRGTEGLSVDATDAQVREALAWDEDGWPWAAYGPIAMAAVRAGVPVAGANLPRSAVRTSMRDASLDARVPPAVLEQLAEDVREGHCNLLPAAQLPGMTRVQIARDAAMADTLLSLARPGRVVVLVAGQNHVDATRGVPRHLRAASPSTTLRTVRFAAGAPDEAASAGYDETWPTPPVPTVDRCADLAGRLGPPR